MSAARPRPRSAVAALCVLAVAAGCASGSDAQPAAEADATSMGGDFEPVTIEHALGVAEITERPERVVTLGMGSAETAIALGVVPVGMEEYPWGSDETGYLPWVHEALTEQGAELPDQFVGATELDVEAVLALEPDLVLAPWSGVTQGQYDQLSAIAPTVAYPEAPWTITWDEQIRTIGQALGEEDAAQGLVDGIEQQLADAARPEYEGITFSYVYHGDPGTLGVFFPDEQRVAMVRALGLTVDPVVETLRDQEVAGTDSAVVSMENAHLLDDSDLVFTWYSDADTRASVEADPMYGSIPAVARGSVVAVEDQSFVTASSIINPLTVPWTIERYVPIIDEAVAQLD
jgi:iron complex transport system substrate-binding protein